MLYGVGVVHMCLSNTYHLFGGVFFIGALIETGIIYLAVFPMSLLYSLHNSLLYFYHFRVEATTIYKIHDEVIKWKHFPRYWPFVRGIHQFPVISPHKGQWRGALMISLICVWINGCVNNGEAGDLRRYRAHYDITVMLCRHFYTYSREYTSKCIVCFRFTVFR